MLGPSDKAASGSGCTSMKNPSTPAPAAAQAKGSTNSRWPLDFVPPPPGKLHAVGGVEDHRIAEAPQDGKDRISTTRLL